MALQELAPQQEIIPLEDRIVQELKSDKVSIERALLVVAGMDEDGIREYTRKIDGIQEEFLEHLSEKSKANADASLSKRDIAILLLEHIHKNTMTERDVFSLKHTIDSYLAGQVTGNCLALTSLYTVLGLRNSLDLAVLYSTEHILCELTIDSKHYPIETTGKDGFNFANIDYSRAGLNALVATAFISRGVAKSKLGLKKEAIEDYNRAIELEPKYADAFNNRGAAKSKLGLEEEAIEDYNRAIELYPNFQLARSNREIALEKYNSMKISRIWDAMGSIISKAFRYVANR